MLDSQFVIATEVENRKAFVESQRHHRVTIKGQLCSLFILNSSCEIRQALRLASNAQAALRRALGTGPEASYRSLLSPPLPSALTQLSDAWQRRMQAPLQNVFLDIVYCGHLDIQSELEDLCKGAGGCNAKLCK